MHLVKYDAACAAIAEARSTDEVKNIRDISDAMRAYARQAKNKQLEVDAAEIRFRAERRIGELMEAQRQTVGLSSGTAGKGRPPLGGSQPDPPKDTRPTLAEAGIDKNLANRARKLAAVDEDTFNGMVSDWRDRVSEETERVTVNLLQEGERAAKKAAQIERFTKKALPVGTFSVLYADPPWSYSNSGFTQSAAQQYPTMHIDDICTYELPNLSESAVLFLWATSPLLPEALRVIRAWGFEYKASMIWVKDRAPGIGWFVNTKHELLLIATRGQAHPVKKLDSVFSAAVGKHSKKPVEAYELIEAMYPDWAKVEAFHRGEPREGWEGWGLESRSA